MLLHEDLEAVSVTISFSALVSKYTRNLLNMRGFVSFLDSFDTFLRQLVQKYLRVAISSYELRPMDSLWFLNGTKEEDMCQNRGYFDTARLL